MSAQTLVTLFLPAALMVIMFGMGLGLVMDDFRRVSRRPLAISLGAFGQLALLPALGFLFAWFFEFSPGTAVGTVLLCACPGGPTSNLFTKLGGGDVALSVSLTAFSGVITVFTIPLITNLGIATFGGDDITVQLPVLLTTFKIGLVVIFPVIAGMRARQRLVDNLPRLARLERRITRTSVLLLAVIIIGAVAKEGPKVARFIGEVGLPIVGLSVAGMLAGFALARIGRLGERQALTMAIEVGMQNGALAIGIAFTMPDPTDLVVPMVVYGLWVYVPCALAAWWGRRRFGAPQSAVL
ncbi:MAG: BASS family bile acid:Na+ symporter [Myxococcota bacterium]